MSNSSEGEKAEETDRWDRKERKRGTSRLRTRKEARKYIQFNKMRLGVVGWDRDSDYTRGIVL